MHGEYKVPGGELVVVDFDVVAGVIRDFRLAGEILLDLGGLHEDVHHAVSGLSANVDAAAITAAIQAALPAGAVPPGFSAEGIAIAIRRALSGATGWRDHEWQLIHDVARPAVMQLALDQVLAEEVSAGRRAPTLRVWEWNTPAVVIGSFQSLRNEVDLVNAEKYGVQIVRRISGGGAMFMEAGAVITYSLYAPTDLVQGMSFAESYAFLDDWAIVALRSLGIEAFYQPLNDIASTAGKIGGAAQKRLAGGVLLHHVTMSYEMDGERMTQVLRIGRERLSDKGIASAVKHVDPLRSQTALSRAEITARLEDTFTGLYGATAGAVTASEHERAVQLVIEKFDTDAWLRRVP